jgi:hypothetical protein
VWDFFDGLARPVPELFWIVAILAVTATGLAAFLWRESRPMRIEAAGAVILVVASVVAAAMQPASPGNFFEPGGADAFQPLLFNVLVAAGALWAIVVGLGTDRDGFVNTALVFVGLLILARYFDFSFRLFDRSLVFIGAGVVLLVTALGLDRLRRRLTAGDRTESESAT